MKKAERRYPVTAAPREIVREILLKDKLSPSRKQTHTAKRIYDLLLEGGRGPTPAGRWKVTPSGWRSTTRAR